MTSWSVALVIVPSSTHASVCFFRARASPQVSPKHVVGALI